MEYAAGAIAAQPTGVGSTFGMRGLTGASRNPTILVDGVPLNMQGFGNLDAIPVNAVERIATANSVWQILMTELRNATGTLRRKHLKASGWRKTVLC